MCSARSSSRYGYCRVTRSRSTATASVLAERQPSAELGLDRGKAELLEARRLGLQRRLVGEVLERPAPPQRRARRRARRPRRRGPGRAAARASLTRASKSSVSRPSRSTRDRVAGAVALDHLTDRLAQLGDVRLQGVASAVGRRLAPHAVDETLDRHRRVRLGEQEREHEPLLRSAELDRSPPAGDPPPAATGATARKGPSTSNRTTPSYEPG